MPDDKKVAEDLLVDSSIENNPDNDDSKGNAGGNSEREGLLKEIQAERAKRHELEAKMAELDSKLNSLPTNSNQNDDELEVAVDKLMPYLQKRGFITQAQSEDEKRAEKYATDLKNLSTKYDGTDGRPSFEPSEIANYAKEQGIFNLEAAYRNKYWKELLDWEKKQSSDDDNIVTEKPNSTSQSNPQGRVKLTLEYLKERMKQPDWKEWYEKNRDKIMAGTASGQIR